jgi:hypothetical protein
VTLVRELCSQLISTTGEGSWVGQLVIASLCLCSVTSVQNHSSAADPARASNVGIGISPPPKKVLVINAARGNVAAQGMSMFDHSRFRS